jgi:hypothetical protein
LGHAHASEYCSGAPLTAHTFSRSFSLYDCPSALGDDSIYPRLLCALEQAGAKVEVTFTPLWEAGTRCDGQRDEVERSLVSCIFHLLTRLACLDTTPSVASRMVYFVRIPAHHRLLLHFCEVRRFDSLGHLAFSVCASESLRVSVLGRPAGVNCFSFRVSVRRAHLSTCHVRIW